MCVSQSQTSPQGALVPHRDKNLLLKESGILFKDSLTSQDFNQVFKYAGHSLPSALKIRSAFDDLRMAKTERSCGLCARSLFSRGVRLLGTRSAGVLEALNPSRLGIDWLSVTKTRQ